MSLQRQYLTSSAQNIQSLTPQTKYPSQNNQMKQNQQFLQQNIPLYKIPQVQKQQLEQQNAQKSSFFTYQSNNREVKKQKEQSSSFKKKRKIQVALQNKQLNGNQLVGNEYDILFGEVGLQYNQEFVNNYQEAEDLFNQQTVNQPISDYDNIINPTQNQNLFINKQPINQANDISAQVQPNQLDVKRDSQILDKSIYDQKFNIAIQSNNMHSQKIIGVQKVQDYDGNLINSQNRYRSRQLNANNKNSRSNAQISKYNSQTSNQSFQSLPKLFPFDNLQKNETKSNHSQNIQQKQLKELKPSMQTMASKIYMHEKESRSQIKPIKGFLGIIQSKSVNNNYYSNSRQEVISKVHNPQESRFMKNRYQTQLNNEQKAQIDIPDDRDQSNNQTTQNGIQGSKMYFNIKSSNITPKISHRSNLNIAYSQNTSPNIKLSKYIESQDQLRSQNALTSKVSQCTIQLAKQQQDQDYASNLSSQQVQKSFQNIMNLNKSQIYLTQPSDEFDLVNLNIENTVITINNDQNLQVNKSYVRKNSQKYKTKKHTKNSSICSLIHQNSSVNTKNSSHIMDYNNLSPISYIKVRDKKTQDISKTIEQQVQLQQKASQNTFQKYVELKSQVFQQSQSFVDKSNSGFRDKILQQKLKRFHEEQRTQMPQLYLKKQNIISKNPNSSYIDLSSQNTLNTTSFINNSIELNNKLNQETQIIVQEQQRLQRNLQMRKLKEFIQRKNKKMRLKYEEMFQNRDQKLHFNYQDQVQVSNEVQNDQSTVLNTQKFDAYSPQRLDQENSENTAANNGQSIFKGQTFASLQQVSHQTTPQNKLKDLLNSQSPQKALIKKLITQTLNKSLLDQSNSLMKIQPLQNKSTIIIKDKLNHSSPINLKSIHHTINQNSHKSSNRKKQRNDYQLLNNNGQNTYKNQFILKNSNSKNNIHNQQRLQQVTVDSLNIQGSSFESLSEFDVKINPWYQNQQLQNSRFDDYISEEDKKEGDSRFKQVNSRSKNNKSNNQISSKQYYSDMNSQINRKPNQKQNVKLTHQIPNLQNKCDFSSEFDSSMIYKELDNDQNVGANHSIATSYKKQFEDFQNQQTTSNYLTKHQEVDQNMQNEDEFELFQQQLLQQQRRPVYQIIKIPTQIAFVE